MTDKSKSATVKGESTPAKTSRPTLFNLLEVLANYSMTTPSQRQCIRDIVTEFLANKFEHSKVYSYIGAVVGHDRLHAVIKQLEADPDRSPLPDQDGLMKIESAFNLTRNYKTTGANGDSCTNKDEILRTIRRNLSKKCELSRSSSVKTASAGVLLQKACWLPIRRTLTAGPLYGHSLICIGNRAYILGGSNGRNQGFNLSKAHLINLLDFSSKQIMLSGEVPTHREGNSCNVAVVNQGHSVVLFGGFNGEVFFNDVYLLDLEKRRWTKRHPTGPLPTPRDEHSALIYPPRCDLKNPNTTTERVTPEAGTSERVMTEGQNAQANSSSETFNNSQLDHQDKDAQENRSTQRSVKSVREGPVVYLFVFGGKTGLLNKFKCLNDMWAYNVLGNYWMMVDTGENKPCPRFGVCALWADDETVCVFGGETSSSNGFVDRTERVLLDDLWMFHLNPLSTGKQLSSTNTQLSTESASETAEDSQLDNTDRSDRNGEVKLSGVWVQDYYEGNIGPRSHYSSIFIAQRCKEVNTGAPRTVERLMFLTGGLTYPPGNKKVVVASDKLYFYFFSQKRWYSLKPNYPRNYIGEPFEPRQLHVACFFEKKNILFPGTKPSVPCIFFHGGFHKKQILSDSWVLSLTGEDLFFKNSLLSTETNNNAKMELRMYPPWYYRESHSPSLLWGMCSVQKWVFGALAHLVDNSLKDTVSSTNLSIKFEPSPKGEELMLSVQDDGNGLDYNSMNRLLKLFGRTYNSYNSTDDPDSRTGKEEYGLGFKLAYGRLGNSVAVMSRTHDSIGIGMLSLDLMCQCESREMAAPMCMWKLPSKELINRDGPCLIDQRHHQRLLMSYSPFNSAALLAEQINVLGVNPGTRLLFWQLRDDLDSLVLEDGTLFSSNHTHNLGSRNAQSDDESKDHREVGSVVYFRDHVMEGGIVMDSNNPNGTKSKHDGASSPAPEQSVPEEQLNNAVSGEQHNEAHENAVDGAVKVEGQGNEEKPAVENENQETAVIDKLEELKSLMGYSGSWYEAFPLWKTAKHSMDYCLPVYLYWLHLHSSCTLSVQDVQLKPNPVHFHLFESNKSVDLDDIDLSTRVESLAQFTQNTTNAVDTSQNNLDKSQSGENFKRVREPFSSAQEEEDAVNYKVTKYNNSVDVKPGETDNSQPEKLTPQKKVPECLGTMAMPNPQLKDQFGKDLSVEECFLDMHNHVLGTNMLGGINNASDLSMDSYSCGKNTCGYCGVSPIGRSLSGGETLYSFLRAKLHKSVQLPFLFHPEDHAQGAFALIGFLNYPTKSAYHSSSSEFSFDKTSNSSVSSNFGNLSSPVKKPLAPTSFVVTEPPEPQPTPPPVSSSPTKSRKAKGQRGKGTTQAQTGNTAQQAPLPKTTQVIFSGSMSSENLGPTSTPEMEAQKKESKSKSGPPMFLGVGAGAPLYSSERSSSNMFLGQQIPRMQPEDRVCEAGVLLYYKGRMIRRLEGNFPAPMDELESAKLPPKASLFRGNMYRFALTAVINVPNWLVPSITKQEFVHENNRVFLTFKAKLIKLLSEYCKVCMDEHKRHSWYLEKLKQIVDYDMANQTTLNSYMTKPDEVEGLDDEVVPSWKLENTESSQENTTREESLNEDAVVAPPEDDVNLSSKNLNLNNVATVTT
ncbi:Galactose oxidase central domain protein [Theileria parva strain Muguga]|uniref:Uncharacterized protein n=1 Tax=Theileria parva TaxID=5875 RepID=Q4N618_THEPA|nr:Galactose oxidase central domain protein [Theileria parva strain Muguga]EAN32405.1 Galactose oxidase central domain protein [Theileria parva strain Muguga]|eukprot:XP_764688.1 hypothetical protein [Theileria parva strain Muguga]